ncbi:MAG: response regulator [Bdellovibrionales bacterium]|nr:response regulator [Bdellovibrionales bacterium]
MALRVLLADESATIKKVIQITLQDFAVELRNVTVGTDVLSVAKSFKPDIIFVDILLQKKSGYEVCSELKASPDFANVPVILLWNSFMDLDQDKLNLANANEKLEKPFDAESLRRLVMRFVPKLQSSPIAEHISPPDLNWNESTNTTNTESKTQSSTETTGVPDFLNDDEPEDFSPMSIQKISKEPTSSIAKFKLDLPSEELGEFENPASTEEDASIDTSSFLWGNELKPEIEEEKETWQQKPTETSVDTQTVPQQSKVKETHSVPASPISETELEAIISSQSREVIERVVRKLVPEIAKEIIQKELERLTKDLEG